MVGVFTCELNFCELKVSPAAMISNIVPHFVLLIFVDNTTLTHAHKLCKIIIKKE